MQFPAGALAAIASQAAGGEGDHHPNSHAQIWQYATSHFQESKVSEALGSKYYNNNDTTPRTKKNFNRQTLPEFSASIGNQLQNLRQVTECNPLTEKRLRGLRDNNSDNSNNIDNHHEMEFNHHKNIHHDDTEDDYDIGILASSACGVGRKCHDGICIDVEGWDHEKFLFRRGLQEIVNYNNPIPNGEDTIPPTISRTYSGTSTGTDGFAVATFPDSPNTETTTDTNGGGASVNNNTPPPGTPQSPETVAPTTSGTTSGTEFEPNVLVTSNRTVVQSMQYACDFGGLLGYDCVCNFELDTYTGNATCVTPLKCTTNTSVCNVEITDCYQESLDLTLRGIPGVWDSEACLKFLRPYEQTICYQTSTLEYGATVEPTCGMSLDGEECRGCRVSSRDEPLEADSSSAIGKTNCYLFDCSNTALAGMGRGSVTGNTCDLPAHTIRLYLDTYGCPPCNLCESDEIMTTPANSMILFEKPYQCAYVQDIALQGFFTVDSCNYFKQKAEEPCGCASPADVIAPVENVTSVGNIETGLPTEGPTEEFDIQNTANSCSICPEGVVPNPEGLISMAQGGEISCGEIDAAGKAGSIAGSELCAAVRLQASGPCCGIEAEDDGEGPSSMEETSCTLCGPGKIHTDETKFVSVPTQGIYSCGDLIEMGGNGTLDDNGICLLVQLSAQTPCGCVADGPTEAPTGVVVPDEEGDASAEGRMVFSRSTVWASAALALSTGVAVCLSW